MIGSRLDAAHEGLRPVPVGADPSLVSAIGEKGAQAIDHRPRRRYFIISFHMKKMRGFVIPSTFQQTTS
jgi:hypothetical protein